MNYFLIIIFFLLYFGISIGAPIEHKCLTNEKFIKGYKFISSLKNSGLTKNEMIAFATELASKCHNTYERFDKVYDITEESDLSVKASIIFAIRVALNKDISISDLKDMYKFLINSKGPDLPYAKAFETAEAFAAKGTYSFKLLKSTFDFCINTKDINFTKPKCIDLSKQVLDMGIRDDSLFRKTYEFFSNDKLINLNSKDSIDYALKVMKYGDNSLKDFKSIYEFAINKKGLNLTRQEALDLANKVLTQAELTEDAKKAQREIFEKEKK